MRALTEKAYSGYVPIIGGPPLPMIENYAPRLARGEVWLAHHGGETLGLIVIDLAAPESALIFSVAVDPDHQGRGVGSRLMSFAEKQARLAGRHELRLYTNARMERNISIYRYLGYRETGRTELKHLPGSIRVDMAKTL